MYTRFNETIVNNPGTPGRGASGDHCPPEIFRVSYTIGSFLHKAGLGYLATIRQSVYLSNKSYWSLVPTASLLARINQNSINLFASNKMRFNITNSYELMKDVAVNLPVNSERSDECIDFIMIITSRNNAPISNFGCGFRWKSEYPWCIIEVKSKHFPTVFKKIEKNKKKKK
ncbi:Uncharacterized protein FWK35_00007123 [Aphis craccivora]|uniref:Uncharacterized protein n=1 Tax=Aphis craccivora TaxID=307492 RepID=A0A6G0Z1G8_APHCR|nr:Uncharacterized protein FWK35_00007123 [Aphis craccivora]